eukprot:9489771-Pyramimonas_sp.AAC.1
MRHRCAGHSRQGDMSPSASSSQVTNNSRQSAPPQGLLSARWEMLESMLLMGTCILVFWERLSRNHPGCKDARGFRIAPNGQPHARKTVRY